MLLGKPLNLTLALVLFEMLRKGFLIQEQAQPLIVGIAKAFQVKQRGLSLEDAKDQRRKAAQKIPAAMSLYEEAFLETIENQPDKPVKNLDFTIAVQPLIRYVASRVGGYSLDETRAYYQALVERAPKEARSDGVLTFERQKVFDRNFGKLLMHEDFEAILNQEDYSYQPVWWRKQPEVVAEIPFAQWAQQVIAELQSNPSLGSVQIELGDEEDLLSATLMNEIAQATFYG